MRQIPHIVERQMKEWEMRRMGNKARSPEDKGPVVCISRGVGVGARLIAKRLSEELNCTILGKDTIDHVAEDLRSQRQLVDALDEQGRLGVERWVEGYLYGSPVEYDEYAKSLVKIFHTAAEQGSVIFLGRGASFVLGLSKAFCVRLVAPLERRVDQLMTYESLTQQEALDKIKRRDAEQIAFTRKVFHRELTDPLAFHMTLNLHTMEYEDAVQVILSSMQTTGFLKKKKILSTTS